MDKRGRDPDERYERVVRALRAAGGRMTPARAAVIRTLVATDGHVTAEDVAAAVQQSQPDVHLSTVYRTLEALEELGTVDHVHLGHGRAVYHLADRRHQHLVCDTCGAVVEVPDADFAVLAAALRTRYGFEIDPRHFAVSGRCGRCAS